MNEVAKFFPSLINANFVIICANATAGKGVLMMQMVTNAFCDNPDGEARPFHRVMLYAPTYAMQESYLDFIMPEWVAPRGSSLDKMIEELIELQGRIPNDERQHVLLIIDDIVGVTNSKRLTQLAAQGRWYKITTVLLVQHLKCVCTPTIRSNATYMLVGKINDASREQLIMNVPTNQFPDKHRLRQWVDQQLAIPYNFIGLSQKPGEPSLFTCKVDYSQYNPVSFRFVDSHGAVVQRSTRVDADGQVDRNYYPPLKADN